VPPLRRPPPRDLAELRLRAAALSGRSLGELARALGVSLAGPPQRTKGLVGQLVERALGATAGNAAEPDFPALGVELKTVPVAPDGTPRGSTFVCTADLEGASRASWATSTVRRRLAHVLFVPVIVEGDELAARRIGCPRFFRPTDEQEALLRADFDDLIGAVGVGEADTLTARAGRCLQLRPKAQNAAVQTLAPDDDGAFILTGPRGFYLRRAFIAAVLADAPTASTGLVGKATW